MVGCPNGGRASGSRCHGRLQRLRARRELLAIRSSEEARENAFQLVRCRIRWFYNDDRDRISKTGFNALYDLWQLSIQSLARDTEPPGTD